MYLAASEVSSLRRAAPFWASLSLIPLIVISATYGGLLVLMVPIAAWYVFGFLDWVVGLDTDNADPMTSDADLFWYNQITLVWAPLQFVLIFGMIYYVGAGDHLNSLEKVGLFIGIGVISGTVGINYSHELIHQSSKIERWLGDILLSMVLYSHFRSEHLHVHHRHVGTPMDPVTARYGEGFWRFYMRVLKQSLLSAFRVEQERLARRNLPWTHSSNPFWRYWALQAVMLALAVLLGGWSGLGLFLVQAGTAIWQLELVNYIEHYGLTRKHLGDGKYEHVKPRHSWNAAHRASNWLLINLQRHSDHHYKPDRRFPVLQNYTAAQAPQLPYGYPVMTIAALFPRYWRSIMNPRVRKWRGMYYPEITDWNAYNKATNPTAH